MLKLRILSVVLVCWLTSSAALAQTPAHVGGEPIYAAGAPRLTSWSSGDEAWYLRNRRIAMVGKILTVVGIVGLIVGASFDSEAHDGVPVIISSWLAQQTGQIGWSIAELRAAKRMQNRGIDISRASGIAAVVGAFTLAPVLWIAGPIQSMRLRDAHGSLLQASLPQPSLTAWGTGLRYSF